jgi:xanthine dehydrogenase YagS FAD-binding subunit
VEAGSLTQAFDAMTDGSLVKAGGIDLMDRLKEGLDSPQRLVNIRNISGLDRIQEMTDGLHLGPLVTLAQLDRHPVVRSKYTALADAAGHAATPHIRNMATLGGNLAQRPRCWYFRNEQFHCLKKGGGHCFAQQGENEFHAIFDNQPCAIVHPSATAIALVALNSKIKLTSSKGTRELPLEQFFILPAEDVHRENVLQPGELITEVIVPAPPAGARSAYTKLGEKESFDWPIAEVAVVLDAPGGTVKTASVILGAAAPVPHRAKAAEAALAGRTVTEESARQAATAALQGATPLHSNHYKVPVFEAVVRRTILAAAGKGSMGA